MIITYIVLIGVLSIFLLGAVLSTIDDIKWNNILILCNKKEAKYSFYFEDNYARIRYKGGIPYLIYDGDNRIIKDHKYFDTDEFDP